MYTLYILMKRKYDFDNKYLGMYSKYIVPTLLLIECTFNKLVENYSLKYVLAFLLPFLHIIFYWFLANGYLGILYVYLLMQFLPVIVLYFTIIGYSWFAYISINKNIYRFIFNKKLQTTYSIITNNLVSRYIPTM